MAGDPLQEEHAVGPAVDDRAVDHVVGDLQERLLPGFGVRLAERQRIGRGAARGAAQSLDRGLPVLETRISLIQPDGPYYRGRSAIAEVRAGATLEDVARLLWDCGTDDPFAMPVPPWPDTVAALAGDTRLPPLERTMAAMPLLALQERHSFNSAPQVRHRVAATLLRQNGGDITVESAPGQGTSFQIYLPRAAGPVVPPPPRPAVPSGTETVLLVEPDQELQKLVRHLLEKSGYRVLLARHGAEAARLSKTYDGPVHLLMAEEGDSSRSLAKRLQSRRSDMKVLFVSENGGESCLAKPFSLGTLAQRVRETLDRR